MLYLLMWIICLMNSGTVTPAYQCLFITTRCVSISPWEAGLNHQNGNLQNQFCAAEFGKPGHNTSLLHTPLHHLATAQ